MHMQRNVIHMSKMIQIRHVPVSLHRTLQARAARAGMTLSDYLKTELERVARRLTMDEIRERLAELEPVNLKESPTRTLRRERDAR